MANVETPNVRAIPRLGPAPERMVPAAVLAPARSVKAAHQPPRKFPWVAKRFANWCVGTVLSATGFHLTGFVLLGVIAIAFPICYWAKIIIDGQRIWGACNSRWGREPEFGLGIHTYGTPEYFRNRRSSVGF